jgi:hypothetical protein
MMGHLHVRDPASNPPAEHGKHGEHGEHEVTGD